jgi:hypothetical protein
MIKIFNTLKGFNLNNRGCKPTDENIAQIYSPEGVEFDFQLFNPFGAVVDSLLIPWVVPMVIKIKPLRGIKFNP